MQEKHETLSEAQVHEQMAIYDHLVKELAIKYGIDNLPIISQAIGCHWQQIVNQGETAMGTVILAFHSISDDSDGTTVIDNRTIGKGNDFQKALISQDISSTVSPMLKKMCALDMPIPLKMKMYALFKKLDKLEELAVPVQEQEEE